MLRNDMGETQHMTCDRRECLPADAPVSLWTPLYASDDLVVLECTDACKLRVPLCSPKANCPPLQGHGPASSQRQSCGRCAALASWGRERVLREHRNSGISAQYLTPSCLASPPTSAVCIERVARNGRRDDALDLERHGCDWE